MDHAEKKPFDKQALGEIWKIIIRRFGEDQCMRIAASLSYTSLLSLVPLMAISFAIFAAFPAFEGVQHEIQAYVFENFVPAAGDAVSSYLNTFMAKTGGMTTLGIVGLGVTAIMLLATIEDALNRIFRVRVKRPFVSRLLMFWAVLTLGPLLMGVSLSLSTYFYALTNWVEQDGLGGVSVSGFLSFVLPNVMVMAALTFFYIFVPNRNISWKNGVIGGVVAGILFAVLKKLFGLYVSNFPSYQAIYGVLAAIPIFLVWMYLTWAVVLMGALLTASLEDFERLDQTKKKEVTPADRMMGALEALRLLKVQHVAGGSLSDHVITKELGSHIAADVMKLLNEAGFVAVTEDEQWVLARDLTETNLAELHKTLGLDLTEASYVHEKPQQAIAAAEQARIQAMSKALAEVVG
ncbi:YihY family inner membrane protein [Terasakiella sp. A23]|uniref:YihY family inner membrane protein n=1 Tax=Terasakiella sp. FCG-A23 TaxID=3080561 RepID=UPI00295446F4|nr:YihY family inner membrane protein [Terasakiella sp. A23]MDV7340117.1 YihY family inner membrane protein [Terasakiella sp. A23]